MSDKPDDKAKETKKEPAAPKPSKAGGIVAIVLPALLAGGASFGATKFANKGGGGAAHAAPVETVHRELKPPGPTVPLEPFLVSLPDANRKAHPMKLTIAVEFDSVAKEEMIKPFVPRIRDSILAYMRSLSYEDATDGQRSEKLRKELLERCRDSGAHLADRVLITDLVSQ